MSLIEKWKRLKWYDSVDDHKNRGNMIYIEADLREAIDEINLCDECDFRERDKLKQKIFGTKS